MSRAYQGLAFRAGRNDTPFLYAQKMQEQGIKNKQLQEKRRQEQQEASQKWVTELMNTDFEAIDIVPDRIVQKRSRELIDKSTKAIRNSPDGIVSQEARFELEEEKFNLKQDYNFLKSINEEVKGVIKEVGGKNSKYYNPSVNATIEEMYKTEILDKDGNVNRQFDPKKLYSAVNSYENLNINEIVKDAVSGLTQTIDEEVELSGGIKKETYLKYGSFTKTKQDKNGNTVFIKDDNNNIEVDATPELVGYLSKNDFMRIAIDGKREELISERGGDVTRKEALDALLKQNNPTERKLTVSKDPRVTSGGGGKEKINLSIVTDDNIDFADADRAIETGVAGYNAIYVDLPQDLTKSLSINTRSIDDKPVSGKFTFTKIGSDGQGNEYIEISKYVTEGDTEQEKIPFNDANIKLIRNNIDKRADRDAFDETVNDLKNQFKEKKQIKVDPQSFDVAANGFKNMIESTNSAMISKMFERYGVEVSDIDVDNGNPFFGFGNSDRFYLEGKGIEGTKWSDKPEDMKSIAKMLYNKNPSKFISEFGSPQDSSSPNYDPNDPL